MHLIEPIIMPSMLYDALPPVGLDTIYDTIGTACNRISLGLGPFSL